MTYWLCITNEENWNVVREKNIWGVAERHRNTIAKVKKGGLKTSRKTTLPLTLRNPSGCSPSLSRGSLNTRLSGFGASLHFAQNPLWGTSDTLGTLSEIAIST
jgi:hypothetical protein